MQQKRMCNKNPCPINCSVSDLHARVRAGRNADPTCPPTHMHARAHTCTPTRLRTQPPSHACTVPRLKGLGLEEMGCVLEEVRRREAHP